MNKQFQLNTPLGGIALHHLLTSDPEHPLIVLTCNTTTIVLWGGYWEHTIFDLETGRNAVNLPRHARFHETAVNGKIMMRCWRGPGSILKRPAKFECRRELKPGKTTWTLAFTAKLLPSKA